MDEYHQLIVLHNELVRALEAVQRNINWVDGKLFEGMSLWHKMACEGFHIAQMARNAGLNATCNMQNGYISVMELRPKGQSNHKVHKVYDLLYPNCEPHWKCSRCGDAWPIHCWTKEDLENKQCPGKDSQNP